MTKKNGAQLISEKPGDNLYKCPHPTSWNMAAPGAHPADLAHNRYSTLTAEKKYTAGVAHKRHHHRSSTNKRLRLHCRRPPTKPSLHQSREVTLRSAKQSATSAGNRAAPILKVGYEKSHARRRGGRGGRARAPAAGGRGGRARTSSRGIEGEEARGCSHGFRRSWPEHGDVETAKEDEVLEEETSRKTAGSRRSR